MLYLIRYIKDNNLIKNHPTFQVWVDSPMAVEATEIYAGNVMGYYDEEAMEYISKGIDIPNSNVLLHSCNRFLCPESGVHRVLPEPGL